MPTVVEYLAEERLHAGVVTGRDKKRLTVADAKGRTVRVTPDKVLFSHASGSIDEVVARIEALTEQVDVPLLWEAVVESEDGGKEAPELAQIFFDDGGSIHSSAVFRALTSDRLHFRRRGKAFSPRTSNEISQVRTQREAEARTAAELAQLAHVVDANNAKSLTPQSADRLERWLRGATDKLLEQSLSNAAKDPARHAFDMLLTLGRFGVADDLEVVQANLLPRPSAVAIAYAEKQPRATPPPSLETSAFSIDDPETREVDDALSVTPDGELFRIDVDVADAAAEVIAGDTVDREARRRAATFYLPTHTSYMLPEAISCDRASLEVDAPRRAVRTSIWVNASGVIQRSDVSRVWLRVGRRLDYHTADQLIESGDEPTAETLRLLARLSDGMASRRRIRGAFAFSRREWRIHVANNGEDIIVTPVPRGSPSRRLVAEMMIQTNGIAAGIAQSTGVPFIYRTQSEPTQELPDVDPHDPTAFLKLRNMIQPASLSLAPSPHWALGLEGYSQISSPLRRYGDLVHQRQLCAHIAGEPLPYTARDMLDVLATVESTEHEMKRVEAAVKQRWAIEFLARQDKSIEREGMVVGEVTGGYKVEVADCGAVGLMMGKGGLDLGETLTVLVERARPRRGTLRLRRVR